MPWHVDARALLSGPSRRGSLYFGRHESRALEGQHVLPGVPQNWQRPLEEAADGCPGGWYRTAYLDSVMRYYRRRTEGGGRVPNPFFDRAPWQVQQAVLYLEAQEERWYAYRDELNAGRWAAGPGKKKKGRR